MNRAQPQPPTQTQCRHARRPGRETRISQRFAAAGPTMANHGNGPFARNLAATFTVYLLEERGRGGQARGGGFDRQTRHIEGRGKNPRSGKRSRVTRTLVPEIVRVTRFFAPPKKLPTSDLPDLRVWVSALRREHLVTQNIAMSDLHNQPDEMIHVRLPAELRAAVERVAQEENRTLSGQVRHIIARAVKAPQQERAVA